MIAHVLKLSLGLLFGIGNILILGWGNSRTYFVRKKSRAKKNGLLKKCMFQSKIKRQIVLLFYPF